jgi:hypothetical protein
MLCVTKAQANLELLSLRDFRREYWLWLLDISFGLAFDISRLLRNEVERVILEAFLFQIISPG